MCLSSVRRHELIPQWPRHTLGFARNAMLMTSVVLEAQRCAGEGWAPKHAKRHTDCNSNSDIKEGASRTTQHREAGVSLSCGPSLTCPKASSLQHPGGSTGLPEATPRRKQVQDVQTHPFRLAEAALAQGSLAHTTLPSASLPLTRPLLFTLSWDNTSLPGSSTQSQLQSVVPFGREHKETCL